MFESIKIGLIKTMKSFRPTSTVYGLHQQVKKGYLADKGWAESWFKKRAIDRDGKPIPWLSYPIIDFLRTRDLTGLHVFEYGSGSSTIWFSQRVEKIISCEHDFDWYERIKSQTKDIGNVEILYRQLEKGSTYQEEVVNQEQEFELILIDGRRRNLCGINSKRALRPNGIIIWDNSDRKEYENGMQDLERSGFKRLDFFGPAPGSFRSTCTSIFYRSDNCLKI